MNCTATTIDDLLDAGYRRVRLPEWDSRAYAEVLPGNDRAILVVTPEYHDDRYPLGVPPWSPCYDSQAWRVLVGVDQAREHTGWIAAAGRRRTRPRWMGPATVEERIMVTVQLPEAA